MIVIMGYKMEIDFLAKNYLKHVFISYKIDCGKASDKMKGTRRNFSAHLAS